MAKCVAQVISARAMVNKLGRVNAVVQGIGIFAVDVQRRQLPHVDRCDGK
jgi:hypothetical protein